MKTTVKTFGRFVAKFPFAGRLAIRPLYRGFRNASTDERTVRFAALSSLLGVFVYAHGVQARLGIVAIRVLIAKKISYFWLTVFLLYTAANAAVVVAQATLLMWVVYAYFMQSRIVPGKPNEPFGGVEVLTMMVVTLGGQFIFSYGAQLYR